MGGEIIVCEICTEKIIVDNMDIVHRAVHDSKVPEYLIEDAVCEGYLELVRVANTYDEHSGIKFGTYAYTCVKKKITWFVIKSKPLTYSTEIMKLCTKIHKYMKENNIENVYKMTEENWDKVGVTDDDIKNDIAKYFAMPKSLQSDNEDGTEFDVIDEAVDIESSVIKSMSMNEVHEYISREYSENAGNVLKYIVDYVVENGTCDCSEIARRIGIKRQSVHKYYKALQNDMNLKDLLSSI